MWSIMKEIIGKMHQHNKSKLPRKLLADKKYITLETEIVKSSMNFSQKLAHLLQERFLLQVIPLKFFRMNPAPPYLKDILPETN